ncbi:amidohydrolase family protein [Pseudonocardia ailaonensis]|uniref:Amidohydrolase family protein n=1 Tax=Pseudonocardia ailaonensis TaxID=367279 RepID=A0ABN2NKP6_9PSEU
MSSVLDSIPVVDVDSHILEPPDLWTSRLPKKWQEVGQAPQVIADPRDGALRWTVAGHMLVGEATHSAAGWDDWYPGRPPSIKEADPGSWNPKHRLERLDEYGVHSQVMFPNILGFYQYAFLDLEPDLRLACVKAYNDFQAEFCAESPKRLIPLANLPLWDLDEAVAELERCREIGHKGVNLGLNVDRLGFPRLRDKYWDPLLSRAQEMGMPINFHVGFNTNEEDINSYKAAGQERLDIAKHSALLLLGNVEQMSEVIMGGICERYPNLNFVSIESGFGYVPFLLESLDWQFKNMGAVQKFPHMLLPSEYFQRQVYATFWFEKHLTHLIHLYPDNVMFETDYPHGTSLSPGPASIAMNARDTIKANLGELPDDILRKVLHDNATRVYNLD